MRWEKTLESSLEGIIDASEKEALFSSLLKTSPTSLRLNERKPGAALEIGEQIPWCPLGFYLKSRPGFHTDVDFHLGRYYVQEAASMFLSHLLNEIEVHPKLILDMCAAPGGKSSILIDAHPDALVVANEVDTKRHQVLEENLTKWGATNVLLAQASSSAMSSLGPTFDLILVDAPCSGEGMLRKSEAARKQYDRGLVEQCVSMQAEILDQIVPTLKPNGILIYSTCTWNRAENEHHFDNRSELNPVRISVPEEWNIAPPINEQICFHRFFPHRTLGEGLSMGVFRKNMSDKKEPRGNKSKSKKSNTHFRNYKSLSFELTDHTVLQNSVGYISAMPDAFVDDLARLSQRIHCRPLLTLGTLDRKERLVPHIALAQQMSCALPYHRENLSPELIEKYLRRESMPKFGRTGEWIIACHDDLPLGFMKDVGRHCNNAYPMSRAIRQNR